MRKKFLVIGMVVLFILIFFMPTSFATTLYNIKEKEESIQITYPVIRSFGIAIVNGTIESPKSMYPLIGKLFRYRFLMNTYFINGTIRPVFAITRLRKINIPKDYSFAKIHGTLCKWNKFEQIGDTDTYCVSGMIIPLVVDLYYK